MKMIKSLVLSAAMAISLVPAVNAATAPTACPAIPLIQKAGLAFVEKDNDNHMYIVAQINKYATTSMWAFAVLMDDTQATSKQDALNKAKDAMKTLSGSPEPTLIDEASEKDKQQWYCLYENQYNYLTVSITPISVSGNNFATFMKAKKQ